MPSMSVYIGGLGEDTQKEDLEREFGRFRNMTKVWVAHNPPGFAFIDFENDDDADEAIKEMNGATINGHEIRVDASRGGSRRGQGRGRGDGGFRGGRGGGGFRGGRDGGFSRGVVEEEAFPEGAPGTVVAVEDMTQDLDIAVVAVEDMTQDLDIAVVVVEDMTQDLDIAAGRPLDRGMTGGKRYPPVGQTAVC